MNIQHFIDQLQKEFDDIPPGTIDGQSVFKEVLYWSSINSVVMATMIEFEYGVILTPEDFKSVNTVIELYTLITNKVKE